MSRTGELSVAKLMAQLAANAAEITVLKAEKEALSRRVVKLEEELALAKLHHCVARSEKHIDRRLFNEAEEATIEDDGEEGDVVELPDIGLPAIEGQTGKKRGRRLYRKICRASVLNTILPTIRRLVPAATTRCIVWARPLPSSSISRSRQRSCRMCGSNTLAATATAPGSTRPS